MPAMPLPTGVKKSDLECVMLRVMPFDVEEDMGEAFHEEDLFYSEGDEDLKYAQGVVADTDAHITLLWGIHPSDHYEESVWTLLDGWDFPQVLINEVGVFNSPDKSYYIVVAHVVPSQALLAGRQRLMVLPYTESEFQYRPHITLAYLKPEADREEWVRRLNAKYAHTFVDSYGLDLGND